MKAQILATIGETALQPAATLNAALAANDRLKYFFSLLQMALDHAEHPQRASVTLKRERIACGIDDDALDGVIGGARMAGKSCRVPGAKALLGRIAKDMQLMAAPVLADQVQADDAKELAGRLDALLAALPSGAGESLDPEIVSAMMRAGHGKADSLHRLVMDLHKRLNTLFAALAQENIDGAAATNLNAADRKLVQAFMAGLNRTARLKFDHPGLATTATRTGGRLVIQNDIGTTDAHVIVIHVEALSVSVTYTDVHAERLAFFQHMLTSRNVSWDKERSAMLAGSEPFYLTTGRFTAADEADCGRYLEFLGSRLVFLIDWNRARKQLRGFLRAPDRLALLAWAAEAEIGHRGFLELGGAGLVNQAIEAGAGLSMHFGDRLCDVLGDEPTQEFLRFTLRAAAEGLLTGQSHMLIRDRIRVTLATYFSNEERQLLSLAAEHAGLIFELASLVRDGLQDGAEGAGKRAHKASRLEHDADDLVMQVREAVRRRPDYVAFRPLLEAGDDAADALEDAAFLLDLDWLDGKPHAALQTLAELLLEASQEWIKALGHAAQIGRASSHAETEDFLAAIDRIATLEHQADDAERALIVAAIKHAEDFRQLHLLTTIGDRFESAADALKLASLMLRTQVLENVIDG